jgi:carbamate kinase
VKPDGDDWRRVVASPDPQRIVQMPAIKRLVESGFVVVCAGGGGVPVVDDGLGGHRGVEAVIDKDLCSALVASDLGADVLVLATDVEAVFVDWGTPEQRALRDTTPAELRAHDFAAGSMGPKVEAVCRFVEGGGTRAAIGSLEQLEQLVAGSAGTQVTAEPSTREPQTPSQEDR